MEIILTELPQITYDEFLTRRIYQNGFIRSLEVIGEAVKRLPIEYRNLHPEIPWKNMAGMRDRLIHGYATVDLENVWNTLNNDIKPLYSQLVNLLE